MLTLTPLLKKLIAPSIWQGVGNKGRKLLVQALRLSEDSSRAHRIAYGCYKRSHIKATPKEVRVIIEVGKLTTFMPGKAPNLFTP